MVTHPALPNGFTLPETPIAVGATADVYACMQGWVLKLFHENRDASYVDAERRAANAAFELTRGIASFNVPRVGERVCVGNKFGLLYAHVNGNTQQVELFKTRPYPTDRFAERLAVLHSRIHVLGLTQAHAETALPLQPDRLCYAIESAKGISKQQRARALHALEQQAPVNFSLCHGDFHMGNVLVNAENEISIIHWNDASLGNPLADVARTSLLITFGESSTATQPEPPAGLSASEFGAMRQRFNQVYLETYFGLNLHQDWRPNLNLWLQIVATARLNENLSPFERKRIEAFIAA